MLVVEDNEDTRDMIAHLFELFGLDVSLATNGRHAFDVFRQHRPRIIVSDISMPEWDGIQFIRAVRALKAEDGGLVPAIAISANSDPDSAMRAGFHAYMPKPLDPTQLLDVVREFIDPQRLDPGQGG